MCRGFDVFVNMVLEDVEEYEITPEGKKVRTFWGTAGIALTPAVLALGAFARAGDPCGDDSLPLPPSCPGPELEIPLLLQVTKLEQILLNGNNIAALVPGGKPDDA